MDDCFIGTCTAPYTYERYSDCDACGGEGQYCCGDSWCTPGLACSSDYSSATCEPCGLSGEPCCEGMFCLTGACANDVCP
jgi:hypothetical protein